MKILTISARYPPYHLGGYEIRSKDIIDELARRGHEILVITSQRETLAKPSGATAKYKVVRRLHIRKNSRSFINEVLVDLQDMVLLDRQIAEFQPDVIYLGHIICLSKALLPDLAGRKIPIVYDEGGTGLIHSWERRGRWFYFAEEYRSRYSVVNKLKPVIVDLTNRFTQNRVRREWIWPNDMRVFFNSDLNRRNAIAKGVPVDGAPVIHSGIDARRFGFSPRNGLGVPVSIIVPGRIEAQKGQRDAVHLVAALRQRGVDATAMLVGEQTSRAYLLQVEEDAIAAGVRGQVMFATMVGQEELIAMYRECDVCFFPSYHRTGYSRVPLEAMACGCIVFSYGNEGSDEVIRNGETGYIVPEGDFEQVANLVAQLTSNAQLAESMASRARRAIETEHTMAAYVDRIEFILNDVLSSG